MPKDIDIQIAGTKELKAILRELPQKTRRKYMLKAWRKSTKPLITAARNNISGYSKSLAKSIGNITGRSKKSAVVYVGPRVKGKWKDSGWYAPFVEFGTSGVKRNRKQGYKRKSDNPAFGWVKNIGRGKRYRDDQPARPFMRPAIMQTSNTVVNHFFEGQRQVFERVVKKYDKKSGLTAYAQAKGRI